MLNVVLQPSRRFSAIRSVQLVHKQLLALRQRLSATRSVQLVHKLQLALRLRLSVHRLVHRLAQRLQLLKFLQLRFRLLRFLQLRFRLLRFLHYSSCWHIKFLQWRGERSILHFFYDVYYPISRYPRYKSSLFKILLFRQKTDKNSFNCQMKLTIVNYITIFAL